MKHVQLNVGEKALHIILVNVRRPRKSFFGFLGCGRFDPGSCHLSTMDGMDTMGHMLCYAALRCAVLHYATRRYAALRNATERDATRRYATRRDATLRDVTQRYATLCNDTPRYAMLRCAALRCATLRNATRRDATLRDATLPNVQVRSQVLSNAMFCRRRNSNSWWECEDISMLVVATKA